MRIVGVLPGLHRVNRGAEIAFISLARSLSKLGNDVTLIGSGDTRPDTAYRFVRAASIGREKFERFPSLPMLRNDTAYEELTFIPGLARNYAPEDFDVSLTCSYPFTNWFLRCRRRSNRRPPHVFVTQNGDWPAAAKNAEFRFFGCDGLVCINPDYFERNKRTWNCALIPNGVDVETFQSAKAARDELGLPKSAKVALMVSALIPSKRVQTGIEAASQVPDCHLLVAGDGPLRSEIDALASKLLPGRFTRISVTPDKMPALYKSADVFLHLSKDEPFGIVYLEAMASGLPVVAPDQPRVRWIVGDREFLVEEDTPAAIARSIGQALVPNPAGISSRSTRVLEFSWDRIARQYQDFLSQLVYAGPTKG